MLIRNLCGMVCPILDWAILRLDLGDDTEAPAPDPRIGEAAVMNAELAKEMAGVSREELAFNRERAAKLDPKFLESVDLGLEMARENRARSGEQWDQYTKTYRPVEERVASDAMKWDSPEELDRAAQVASADVTRGFSGARDERARELARMGINPASGRFIGDMDRLGLAEAAGAAGAANTARDTRRLQGLAMRENVAKFGRNMPATGIAADTAALSGAGTAVGAANANLMARPNAVNASLPWMGSAASANSGAGSLLLGQDQARLNAWGMGQQADAALWGGLGQAAGTGLGIWAARALPLAASSEDVKEDKEPVDAELLLEGLESIPVEAWKYKKGMGDGKRHMGPYAEDVHREFGDAAAPGGEGLDLVTMNGITLAGIQALAKKVKKLERLGLDSVAPRAKRDTEPRGRPQAKRMSYEAEVIE